MDEESLTGMLSQLIPDGTEAEPGKEEENIDEQKGSLEQF